MRALALLLALATLAGCFGPEPAEPASTAGMPLSSPTSETLAPLASAPEGWPVGRTWTWELTSTASPPQTFRTMLLARDGDEALIGFETVEAAALALPFHMVPAGRVREADLSYDVHGEPNPLVARPVEDGAAWSMTNHMGEGLAFTARAATIAGPEGDEEGVVVEAEYSGGGVALSYDWSPARGIFTELRYLYGGEEPFSVLRLVAQEDAATARGVLVEVEVLLVAQTPGAPDDPTGAAQAHPVALGEAPYVQMVCWLGTGGGAYAVRLTRAGAASAACDFSPVAPGVGYQTTLVPSTAGSAEVTLATAGGSFLMVELFSLAPQERTAG